MDKQSNRWFEYLITHFSHEQAKLLDSYATTLELNSIPIIFEVDHLSRLLGIEFALLSRMIGASNLFYRHFSIPKRSGSIRLIESPYPKLIYVQQWIKSNILDTRPVSNLAFAYVKGGSHINNAKQHIGAKELLKIDLVNFFEHITFSSVKEVFRECGYSDKLSHQLAKLCCNRERLPQGSPTSPTISNIIFLELDNKLESLAKKHNIIYTRYADDICFSGELVSEEFYSIVRSLIESEGFHINKKKSKILKSNHRKVVTGLVVSGPTIRVPKKYRREYRKESYYLLKNGINQFNGNIDEFNPLYIDEIIGKGQYILTVEPDNEYVKNSLSQLSELKKEILSLSSPSDSL